jgi:hypothetical protein
VDVPASEPGIVVMMCGLAGVKEPHGEGEHIIVQS